MDFLKPSINLPAISTGTSLMKMSGGLGGGGTTQMSPMESMKEVFLEIRDNTKQTVELLKVAVMGTAQERKEERIGAGDTDKEEKGPGILSKVGSTLGKLNPFGGGGMLDTLGKLVLAVGGIALLKIFGDKAVGPLADLIESIKKGKISENISKAYEYVKEVGVNAFEKLKENTILFIDGVKTVFSLVEGAYTAVKDYIMSYDTGGAGPGGRYGDGKLDEFERGKMLDDIVEPLKESIFGFAGKLVTALVSSIGLITVAGIFSRLGPSAAVGAAGIGLFGAAALAAVAAAGIYSLYDRIQFAFNDELDKTPVPDNIVDKSSNVVSKFLGGTDPEGGVVNAMENAVTMGLIGAVIGGIAGSFFFGVGAVPGAAIGFRIGTLMGAGFGFVGSDELKKDMPSMANARENTDKLISFFTGRETEKNTNMEVLKNTDKILTESLITAEKNLAENDTSFNRKIVKNLNKAKVKNDLLIENQAENLAERMSKGGITEIDNQIYAENERLKSIRFGIENNYDQNQIDAALGPDGLIAEIEENIKFLEQDRIDLIQKYQNSNDLNKDLNIDLNETKKKTSSLILNPGGPGHPSNATIVANNKTNSDNSKIEQHQHNGLTSGNPNSITQALAHSKALNMRGM